MTQQPKSRAKSPTTHAKWIPGNPGNSGGKPGRSGRKPASWKAACQAALDDANAVMILQAIIAGDIKEQLATTPAGEPIYGSTKNSDRIAAMRFLAAYGHGEPVQSVEVESSVTHYVVEVPAKQETPEAWRAKFARSHAN